MECETIMILNIKMMKWKNRNLKNTTSSASHRSHETLHNSNTTLTEIATLYSQTLEENAAYPETDKVIIDMFLFLFLQFSH